MESIKPLHKHSGRATLDFTLFGFLVRLYTAEDPDRFLLFRTWVYTRPKETQEIQYFLVGRIRRASSPAAALRIIIGPWCLYIGRLLD